MVVEEKVTQVPIGQVKPAPDNPRQKVGDVAELAMSIKSVGIRSPILARQVGDHFEVVAGARRLAAAELAGLDTVPIIVQEFDEHERVLVMAIENLQREDLSPLEEARAYQRLLDALGVSQRELAPRVGKTQSHISKRLALLALPKDVQGRVDSGGIAIADALELTKLADHPPRLKAALAGPEFQSLERRVRHQLEELDLDRQIEKLETEMESKGLRTIRVRSEFQLTSGVHLLKGGNPNYTSWEALQITPKQHEQYDCHAIAIDDRGLGFPVCTDRKQHPKVKTKREADRAKSTSSSGGKTTFQQPRETPERKALKEARARRLQLVETLLAKKPPKEALQFVLRVFVEQQLELCEGDMSLDRAAIWLGLADAPEDGSGLLPDDVAVEPLLREFAAEGDAQLQRTAFALAAADVDSDSSYNGVNEYLRGGELRAQNLRVSAYLEFLRSQGHELGELELKGLDEAQPATAAAAA